MMQRYDTTKNVQKGIDISSHNEEVDMEKVKKSGVEFVIIRLGYGKNQKQIDKRFVENYNNAIKADIPVGVYLYSYAIDAEDAKKEAELVLKNIKNLKIEYPIFLDMEDADNYKAKRNIENDTLIDICENFCNAIEEAGYYVGIYANLDWLNNKLNNVRLDRFDKWVAQWADKCDYSKDFGMWQFCSDGDIEGITGKVDLNYAFKDYKNIIRKAGLNNLSIQKFEHIVEKGENLSTIAKQYDVSWEKIYEDNKQIIGDNPNLILQGQKLTIYKEEC